MICRFAHFTVFSLSLPQWLFSPYFLAISRAAPVCFTFSTCVPAVPLIREATYLATLKSHYFFLNWRIIALQNFVVFCQTSTWISHRYTYIPSLLNLPPISHSWGLPECIGVCSGLFSSPWTIAHKAPLSLGLPRQEYWSELLFPPPRGSSQPRDWTHVFYSPCIGRRVLYPWATWEVQGLPSTL